MTLEFPQAHEHDPNEDVGGLEHREEDQLEKIRDGAIDASLFLSGFALALQRAKEVGEKVVTGVGFAAALTACGDFSSISSPETQTKIITIAPTVEKKFDKGEISFHRCAPAVEKHGGKNVQITQHMLIVEDAERKPDGKAPPYYGARFIHENYEGSDETHVFTNFFADDERAYIEPCAMHIIKGSELDRDRNMMLLKNLNIRLNVLRALRQTPGTDVEQQATLGQIHEFIEKLDKEFPASYDAKLLEQIINNRN